MHTTEANAEGLLHRGLGGVELFDFPAQAAAALRSELDALTREGHTRLSFHSPMPRPSYFRHDGVCCFFLHEDAALRDLSFRVLEETLAHARAWGAAYVVTHLTYGKTDTADRDCALRLARAACLRLADLSERYAMPIDIEFAAYSSAFAAPEDFLAAMLGQPQLGICLDTGHAALGARIRQRTYLDDIRKLAPRARSMHLWNTRGPEDARHRGHVPLHPRQTPEQGWIDMEETLRIVLAHNPRISVVFEYPVAHVTAEIREGYDWIAGLVRRHASDPQFPAEDSA
ncbi:MAG TPA: sugar phosphate isomerase/epimerase [Gammaproteobacteria bacterium]|nr:sugar phosphate isomerase/epimerase [Gammaproteobacteria bacterium]